MFLLLDDNENIPRNRGFGSAGLEFDYDHHDYALRLTGAVRLAAEEPLKLLVRRVRVPNWKDAPRTGALSLRITVESLF